MHKKVTISLPPELAERWNKAVEKHSLVKSVMVQNYLLAVLPMLEKRDPHSIINFRIEDNSKNLFEYEYTDADFDEQWRELQERKQG